MQMLGLALALLHLPFAPFQGVELPIQVFIFALKPLFLFLNTEACFFGLRFGLVAKLERVVLCLKEYLLLLGTCLFKQQACLGFSLLDARTGIVSFPEHAQGRADHHTYQNDWHGPE
jgi:hypothetical protein